MLTDDHEVFEYLQCIHDQGRTETRYLHACRGFNYRMTNLQAALLLGQLEILPEILERRNYVYHYYLDCLSTDERIRPQTSAPNTNHSQGMFGVRIIGSTGFAVAEPFFRERGIEIRPMFYPMSAHGHLRRFGSFPETNAQTLNRECLLLPTFAELKKQELDHVIDSVRRSQ